MSDSVQQLCAQGQDQLLATDYLAAEATLAQAEAIALREHDWDSLARLYMPLQESRRLIRQRAGEGIIRLDWIARSDVEQIDVEQIAAAHLQGQVLVAGFGSIEPAKRLRAIAHEQNRYLDVILAASYWVSGAVVVAIVPTDRVNLPEAGEYSVDSLSHRLPPHTVIVPARDLPVGAVKGSPETFAVTMNLWERLHLPYLSLAGHTSDLRRRIDAYRDTIAVDYACELAHQHLSNTAHALARAQRE